MNEIKLEDVQLVLANPHAAVRSGLRMALNDAGVANGNITDGGDIDVLAESLQGRHGPDIIICDTSLRGGDVLRTLLAIRNSELGPNPFLGIIAIGSDSSLDSIRKVMDTGADLFLAAPFSPQQILDRIKWLVYKRRQFVVAPNYVGPDRRNVIREDDTAERFHAPNTLRYKAIGNWDPEAAELEIKTAVTQLNDQRLQRFALNLARSAEEFALECQLTPGAVQPGRLQQLSDLVADLKKRAVGIGLDPVARLCSAAQSIIVRLRNPDLADLLRDIEILQQLTFAIRAGVNPDERHNILATDIANVVATGDR